MGIKENFTNGVLHAPSPEEQARFAKQQDNAQEDSHLQPGAYFDPERMARENRQRIRRMEALQKTAETLALRVKEPSGDRVLKLAWKEYLLLRQDALFTPFSRYATNLLFYADGTQRPQPVRPLLENEVGMYKDKIVVLRDAGPDDAGEGKYFSGYDLGQGDPVDWAEKKGFIAPEKPEEKK